MTGVEIIGVLFFLALGGSISLFRKGGLYNPIEAQKTPQKPISGLVDVSKDVYAFADSHQEQHLTLNSNVSPEVGCAEAVSFILLNCDFPIPQGGISTVAGLTDFMVQQGFEETAEMGAGYVIVGRSPTDAHIGICGKEWIMSNTSFDLPQLGLHKGKWEANYHIKGWKKEFPSTRFFIPMRPVA